MDALPSSSRIDRFGVFEYNRHSGELRKAGLRIRVADQSLQVLATLLDRPGEVVTREELAKVLWPDGTYVDYENGLNAAVKKLRSALGDSGSSPRYVETLARRGYRLIVPVNTSNGGVPAAPTTRRPYNNLRRIAGIAGLLLLLVATVLIISKMSNGRKEVAGKAGFGRPSPNPEANAYFAKAELFMGMGVYDPDRSKEMLEQALRIDRNFGKARSEYGFTHLIMVMRGHSNDRSDLYKAEEEIRQGLRDDPNFSHGYAGLAALYLHHGRKDQAPAEIQKALKLNSNDIDARHWMAVYHWYSGDTDAARKMETEISAKYPRFFPARMTLGDLAREDGDWESSIRHYQQILEYDSQNGFVLERLARVYMDRNDFALARQTLDRLRPHDRRNFRTRALEALLLALEGKRRKASALMDPEILKYIDLNALFTLTGAEFNAVMHLRPQAYYWLERAVRQGDDRVAWFARNPALENIRDEPRFRQIQSSIAARQAQSRKTN